MHKQLIQNRNCNKKIYRWEGKEQNKKMKKANKKGWIFENICCGMDVLGNEENGKGDQFEGVNGSHMLGMV